MGEPPSKPERLANLNSQEPGAKSGRVAQVARLTQSDLEGRLYEIEGVRFVPKKRPRGRKQDRRVTLERLAEYGLSIETPGLDGCLDLWRTVDRRHPQDQRADRIVHNHTE